MSCTEASEAAINGRPCAPVFELYGSKPMANPRIQIFERLRGLCQAEVRLPSWQVFPHLFSHLGHASSADSFGDGFNALLERFDSLGCHSHLNRVPGPPPKAVTKELTAED